MTLIDLSRDIYHKMPRLLNHPSIVITPYSTHDEIRVADGYKFSAATMSLALGDHAGRHVDAPKHFDARPSALSWAQRHDLPRGCRVVQHRALDRREMDPTSAPNGSVAAKAMGGKRRRRVDH